ncbi:hypothetical protein [Tabrizicola aquatica]|uniref:hypothetical protein n=1 Tax=Tabrizicola aquatica TaxID=909926 RepID=UPI0011AFA3B8|nr:hypothetical protein [Tabrizicola aquatica]
MRIDSRWISIGLTALTIVSIPTLHVLGFLAGMPEASRQFTDVRFTLGLTASFSTGLAIAAFFAGYAPKLFLGIFIYVFESMIESKYYRRGYRRVYVPFTGFGKISRRIRTAQEMAEHFRESGRFDRAKARFTNFKQKKLNERFPVRLYARYQYAASGLISILVFSVFYVGWIRSALFIVVFGVIGIALLIFKMYGTGHIFDLKKRWWDEQKTTIDDPSELFDADLLPTLLSVVAICSFSLGYFRFGYVSNSPDFQITIGTGVNYNLVGPNSDGILVIDKVQGSLLLVPYSGVGNLRF